jgi:hypothetical protein
MSGNMIARTTLVGIVTLVGIYGCGEKSAQQSPATEIRKQPSAARLSNQGVRAYIDPATGELRDPTPEELAAEAAAEAQKKQATAANPQSEQPQSRETILPSGAVEITLDKSAQHSLQACIGKNGDLKMEHECDSEASGAKR